MRYRAMIQQNGIWVTDRRSKTSGFYTMQGVYRHGACDYLPAEYVRQLAGLA